MKLLKAAIWFSPSHSLLDIRYLVSGMKFSIERLFPGISGYDAWQQGTNFEIPFFIFQGENDVLTVPGLAKAFFEDVTAPSEDFVLISDAGHFAAFVKPEQFLHELLTRVRTMVVL